MRRRARPPPAPTSLAPAVRSGRSRPRSASKSIVTRPALTGLASSGRARPRAAAPAIRAPAAAARSCRSRAARPCAANTARASSLISRGVRVRRDASARASSPRLARPARPPRAAVECRSRAARSRSSSRKRRLVHQQVGAERGVDDRRRRAGCRPRRRSVRPGRAGPSTSSGRDHLAAVERHRARRAAAARTSGPRARPGARAASRSNRPGRSSSHSAQPRLGRRGRSANGAMPVAVALDARRPVAARRSSHGYGSRPITGANDVHQRAQPGRPVQSQRRLAAAQVVGLQQPGQPEQVVGVVVA